MAGVSRETLKWLQSLDLTWPIQNPKWELCNGYLFAEIFSWYYPNIISMHHFNNGLSLHSKQKNWDFLKGFLEKQSIDIPNEFIEGTIHCKSGAAQLLLERVYQVLTNRPITRIDLNKLDFSDTPYQEQLPFHAKSTAIQNLRNNISITELVARPSLLHQALEADQLMKKHMEKRQTERLLYPERFDKGLTMGEKCPRSEPMQIQTEDSAYSFQDQTKPGSGRPRQTSPRVSITEKGTPANHKEISVRQLGVNDAYQHV